MPFLVIYSLIIVLISIPVHSFAETTITPGEYVTEGGWGDLKIVKAKGGGLKFEIIAIGANGHTCDLEGKITNGQAQLEGTEDKPCIVKFQPTENGINVTDNDGGCRVYCGARAGFTDMYLKPPTGCDARSIEKTRKAFKQLYSKKAYSQARQKLELLMNSCSKLLLWTEIGEIRNDLARTQFKLGDYSACLNTLKPLEEDAKRSNEELKEAYPPADADIRIEIAETTRLNMKRCGAK